MKEGRRYTGTYHDDGSLDCSRGLGGCQYEQDGECHHCHQPVREHIDEDGSYLLVEPIPPLQPTVDLGPL